MLTAQRADAKTRVDTTDAFFDSLTVDASTIEQHLRGLRYPAGKLDILHRAKMNQAPDKVIAFYVFTLPERRYDHPSDVSFTAFMNAYFSGRTDASMLIKEFSLEASLPVGETRAAGLLRPIRLNSAVKPLPWASLGVIGVHRGACLNLIQTPF
jgi:hypothetical protein